MPDDRAHIFSDCLGLAISRVGAISVGFSTVEYADFALLLNSWLQQNVPNVDDCPAGVPCTSICINAGYGAKRHRDKNNIGLSWSKAFGNFRGGKLKYFFEDDRSSPTESLDSAPYSIIDLRAGLCLFNGHCAHEVTPYTTRRDEDQRYSLVFYVNRHINKADQQTQRLLEQCGFVIPTNESMSSVSALLDSAKHAGVASKPIHARIYVQPSPWQHVEACWDTSRYTSCPAAVPTNKLWCGMTTPMTFNRETCEWVSNPKR